MRIRLKHDRLMDLLAERNLSQNHWAIKLGLSKGHWSDIVNGKHPYPSQKTRERMLEVLDISFDELFAMAADSSGGTEAGFKAALSDRYIIDRELGHGGMGVVYLARDVKHGRNVAIKVVSPEAVSGIGAKQFLKEIRRTAQLTHPHILPLYDSGEAKGQPFYVMPYIKDGSLRDRLVASGRLSLDDTVRIAGGVAAALQHAHEQRVLHCDVKPENVLLAGDHAYVSDFGISRAIHSEVFEWGRQAELDTSAGTPAYVSPEQASGEVHLEARSDVYSFGCMVFELLAGRPPFVGTKTMQIVSQRFTSAVPDLMDHAPRVPAPVAAAVGRAMELLVPRRPASVHQFMSELETGAHRPRSHLVENAGMALTRLMRRVTRAGSGSPTTSGVRGAIRMTRQDIGYAVRSLLRAPGFASVVVLTLAFGIAANTLIFSTINPYFVRPLPFGDSERLVQLGQVDAVRGWDGARFSLPMYLDYREQATSFAALATYHYGHRNLTGAEGAERVQVGTLSANMFGVLDVVPLLGRTFSPADGVGAAPVVVLGYGIWQRRYGGQADVIGREIELDGTMHAVIGVMPERFNFPFGGVKLWVPNQHDPALTARDHTGDIIVGRLGPGQSTAQAHQELVAIQQRLGEQYPAADGRFSGMSVKPLREALNFGYDILRVSFALLLAAVGFALLIACVNVASLILARAGARTREFAVRAALGAGRRRLVMQQLAESGVLAVAGGVVGVLLAYVGVRIVGPVMPEDLYRVGDMSIDGTVLIFSAIVTLATPVLFGLAPALTAVGGDLVTALKDSTQGAGAGSRAVRRRQVLVVFEIAMAVTLVAGTGLMVRSFAAINRVDLGFDAERILTLEVTPPSSDYPDLDGVADYFERATTAIAALPGVRSAGTVTRLPLNHETFLAQYSRPESASSETDDWPVAILNRASGDYFATMGIQLVAGRTFDRRDTPETPPVVVITRSLADAVTAGSPVLGRTLLVGGPNDPVAATVVGIVADGRHSEVDGQLRPQIYRPVTQSPVRRRFIVAATAGPPAAAATAAQRALGSIDPNLPVAVRPMADIVTENTYQWSLSSAMLAVFGSGAVLLAALGIYGLIAFSVSRRRREIGIRMALGATRAQVRRGFLNEGLRLVLYGLAIGLGLALIVGRIMASLLFGVSPFDPVTFGGVLIIFAVVAMGASLVPAIRASRVDPLVALRQE